MLAIKSRQTDHPDAVKNVATAAAYSLDRTQLFRLVAPQMIAPQEVWVEEEILELKPIITLKRKLEEELSAISREEKQEPSKTEASLAVAAEPVLPADSNVPPPTTLIRSEALEATSLPQIRYQTFDSWLSKFQPVSIVALPPATEAVTTVPETVVVPPLPTITSQSVDDQDIDEDEKEEDHGRPAPKVAGIAQVFAEKSVAENKDVISETLAKLYVKQGYRDKAIAMYDRLGLAFPEKSAYFAAEIDKLKK
ncbi:MAG: hypothetical protein IPH31_22265 [Lewinellaceae bacterium]|nr:hypothetical protein [Lewinellaceae bacterium]